MPTARVADSYGEDPHEFKPSQEPFDPDAILEQEEECPGNSSSNSDDNSESSETKQPNSTDEPAPSAESRTPSTRPASASAGTTGTKPKK